MIDHFGINCADIKVAATFYDKVLGMLGHRRILGFWPEYHGAYYGGFVRDPDGNNVEAVCHSGDA